VPIYLKALTVSISKHFYTVLTLFVSVQFSPWIFKLFVHNLNGSIILNHSRDSTSPNADNGAVRSVPGLWSPRF
jgi:hypothetical protein